MIHDVDAFSRYHYPLVAVHMSCASMYHRQNITNHSDTYRSSVFDSILNSYKYTLHKRKPKLRTAASISACPLKRKAQLPLIRNL